MTGYELVFITDPSHNKDELESVLKNFKKILTKSGGKLIHEYVWGRRRLAYEISGNDFGVYLVWYFTGAGKTVEELKRQIGFSDSILRHQIIKTNDIDTEAAFLQTLIPPKEDTSENEEALEQFGENKKESAKKANAVTENENTLTDDVEKFDTESDVKIEESDNDDEKEKTESVDDFNTKPV